MIILATLVGLDSQMIIAPGSHQSGAVLYVAALGGFRYGVAGVVISYARPHTIPSNDEQKASCCKAY